MHWQNTVGKIRAQMTATSNAAAASAGSVAGQPRKTSDSASLAAATTVFPSPGSFDSASTLGSSFLGGAGGGPFSLGSGALAAANALDAGLGRDSSIAGSVRSVGSIGSLDQVKPPVTSRPVYAPGASGRANSMAAAPSSLPFYPQGAPGMSPGSSRPVYDPSEEMPAMPMPGRGGVSIQHPINFSQDPSRKYFGIFYLPVFPCLRALS